MHTPHLMTSGAVPRRPRLALSMLAAITLSFFNAPTMASNLVVYPMTLDVDHARKGIGQITLYSHADHVVYVKVSAKRIVDPGTPDEREVEAAVGQGDIVVSPQRLVVPAGGSRAVRVIRQGNPERETVYRVYFEPVTAAVAGVDTDDSKDESAGGEVSINLVWAPLVRVIPDTRNVDMSVVAANDSIHLSNEGNVRIGALDIGQCTTPSHDDNCTWTPVNKSIFPGLSLEIPYDKATEPGRTVLRYRSGGENAPAYRTLLQ